MTQPLHLSADSPAVVYHHPFRRLTIATVRSSGFTLIETILALTLSSFMLVVIFSLIESTARYQVTGNDQVLASERLLGVLQDLRFDLRSIPADPTWFRPNQVAPSSDELGLAIAGTASLLQLRDMATYAEPIALAGDSRWLMLSLPSANPRMILNQPAAQRPVQQVVWALGGNDLSPIPTHEDRGRMRTSGLPSLSRDGLWRVELGSAGVKSEGTKPALIALASSLRFRYFDGRQWHSSWNSSMRKALPRAVEIELTSIDSSRRCWTIALTTAAASPGEVR